MIINHNMSALFAQRQSGINEINLSKTMEKLTSGERINRAGDDASGLAVSEKLRSQIRGLNQASKNTQNGISFIQTAEGYLTETTDVLQRLRELAVQAANGIYSDEDRSYIQVEVSQLVDELDRIASHAQFNGMNLLSGRFARANGENVVTASMWFHVGANMDQRVQVFIGTMTATALGVRQQGDAVSVFNEDSSNMTLGTIDQALRKVNAQRASLGATQNRLEFTQKGINIAAENMQAAESIIRDTDFAAEMVNHTKNQILQQSITSMLAHSMNQDYILKLLQ